MFQEPKKSRVRRAWLRKRILTAWFLQYEIKRISDFNQLNSASPLWELQLSVHLNLIFSCIPIGHCRNTNIWSHWIFNSILLRLLEHNYIPNLLSTLFSLPSIFYPLNSPKIQAILSKRASLKTKQGEWQEKKELSEQSYPLAEQKFTINETYYTWTIRFISFSLKNQEDK